MGASVVSKGVFSAEGYLGNGGLRCENVIAPVNHCLRSYGHAS
jgi:hypothetical protein